MNTLTVSCQSYNIEVSVRIYTLEEQIQQPLDERNLFQTPLKTKIAIFIRFLNKAHGSLIQNTPRDMSPLDTSWGEALLSIH